MEHESLEGWCNQCAKVRAATADSDLSFMSCSVCGERMKHVSKITEADRAAERFMDWMRDVMGEEKWGPSPGGAAGLLKCSRASVDDLVRAGVLERSEYNADGHHVIMISDRSIKRAIENKRRTGRWTGLPKGFKPDEY